MNVRQPLSSKMKRMLIIKLIYAIGSMAVVAGAPDTKVEAPEPIAEPLKCDSLFVLPNGGIIANGSRQQSYICSPGTNKWKELEQMGMYCADESQISPTNLNHIFIRGRAGFVSVDGGASWRQAHPQYMNIDGKDTQIGMSFWSIEKPDTLILQTAGFREEEKILEMEVATGKTAPWSSTPQPFSRYKRVGKTHFGWMGSFDSIPLPPKIVSSVDDGKTWKPVSPEQSPWSLYMLAQAQRDQLLPPSKRPENSRLAVTWAVEISGIAFCRFECLVGEKVDPSLPTLFCSPDRGKTWAPVPLATRTADVRTLFAGSPFVTQGAKANAVVDPNGYLKLHFDPKAQRVFVGLNGEWFYTAIKDREWRRINRLK